MILSLSLVGSFSNSYAEVNFITIFSTVDPNAAPNTGTNPFSVVVDSNDRIIVADSQRKQVLIYNSDGVLTDSFHGIDDNGVVFSFPVAVDSNDRIL